MDPMQPVVTPDAGDDNTRPLIGDAVALAPVPEPDLVFIGAHPANFNVGRGGIAPEAVVLHIAEGSMSAVDGHFNNPASQVSAHFCVGKNGVIHQYVNTGDTAFGNGIVETGHTAKLINI